MPWLQRLGEPQSNRETEREGVLGTLVIVMMVGFPTDLIGKSQKGETIMFARSVAVVVAIALSLVASAAVAQCCGYTTYYEPSTAYYAPSSCASGACGVSSSCGSCCGGYSTSYYTPYTSYYTPYTSYYSPYTSYYSPGYYSSYYRRGCCW